MITYLKDGKRFLLIANSSRGVMKLPTDTFGAAKAIAERVSGGESAGTKYETISDWKQIHQLALLGANQALVLRRTDAGRMDLQTLALP